MSHKGKISTHILAKRLDELASAVTKGEMSRFVMRVPAELDRDADFVLSQAAERLVELATETAQRGARLQILWEYMSLVDKYNFIKYDHPEAADWFDDDGVPL